jgi:hypothetical protein
MFKLKPIRQRSVRLRIQDLCLILFSLQINPEEHRMAKLDLVDEITLLKSQNGKDLLYMEDQPLPLR